MMTRRTALLTGGAAAVAFLTPGGLMAADAHFGEYRGVMVAAASRGASFEECLTRLVYDETGMVMPRGFKEAGTLHVFDVHYGQDWMFRLKNWGVDNCPAIRQHKTSTLAQVIFCPPEKPAKDDAPDLVMILGEGMFLPLAAFYKADRPEALLRQVYDAVYQPAVPADNSHFLRPYDAGYALQLLASGEPARIEKYIEEAAQNLWVAPEAEIEKRMRFMTLAARSNDPHTQRAVFRIFGYNARVVQGVPIIVDALNRHRQLDQQVLDEALDAARFLMYETHGRLERIVRLEQQFGTTTVAGIRAKTGGKIDAEWIKEIDELARAIPPSRQWTLEHNIVLRTAIEKVLEEAKLDEHARKQAVEGLQKYSL